MAFLIQYLTRYNEVSAYKNTYWKASNYRIGTDNGCNAIYWNQKNAYYVKYINRQSFQLDRRILLMTLFNVFNIMEVRSGISLTTEEFKGS